MEPRAVAEALRASWSVETSRHWLLEDPARGQCNVTALVVHDLFGGEILKTATPGGWHFYNRIGGVRHDFTSGQFAEPPPYADVPSDRGEALSGTMAERHRLLADRVGSRLARRG